MPNTPLQEDEDDDDDNNNNVAINPNISNHQVTIEDIYERHEENDNLMNTLLGSNQNKNNNK